jgi:hypothetical protein
MKGKRRRSASVYSLALREAAFAVPAAVAAVAAASAVAAAEETAVKEAAAGAVAAAVANGGGVLLRFGIPACDAAARLLRLLL